MHYTLWSNGDGEAAEPPALRDIPKDEWEYVFEFIQDEFLWDRDWEIPFLGGNFALVQQQPHWPTFQEYRTAKTWLLSVYENTRANRTEVKELTSKIVERPAEFPRPGKSHHKSKAKEIVSAEALAT
jgi:hypothetical protein